MAKRVLVRHADGEETREVWLLEGPSLAVVEETRGPVTEVAYGSCMHGHKVLLSEDVCRAVLGCTGSAAAGLERYFARDGGDVMLSDLMDALDRSGQGYSYASWGDEGDATFRGSGA